MRRGSRDMALFGFDDEEQSDVDDEVAGDEEQRQKFAASTNFNAPGT